ncbi:ABC transporter permease [Chryseosolibacter histidini]|uniref:ABC transporter permease n=1 Tax=Chryseosolibacter histidini TaxID=2782349 RepID=UPI0020B1ED50|nr:ABC transporter permease [Chryseosolibacter histidini]
METIFDLSQTTSSKKSWAWEIKPESFWWKGQFLQLWSYRHLLLRLVRRDFLIHHQQTLLGPLWIVFQPVIVLIIYVLIFEKAVGLSTDGLPPSLFYLSGIILWTLFAECFTGTSFTFIQNGSLFGKVYFPRLIMPLSVMLVNFIRFGIQFLIFFVMLLVVDPRQVIDHPLRWFSAMIFSTVVVASFGLGMGLIFSILTAKYRDLVNVIHLIVRLLMFATPIIYPLSIVDPAFRLWVSLNPMCPVVEFFRFGFMGQGTFTGVQLLYSAGSTLLLVLAGSLLFNKFGNRLQDVI